MRSLCLFLNEDHMATRNDNDQNKAADEAARTARTVTDEAARVGEQTARAGADMARRGTETARATFHAGPNTARETFQSPLDPARGDLQGETGPFNSGLGFNGPELGRVGPPLIPEPAGCLAGQLGAGA